MRLLKVIFRNEAIFKEGVKAGFNLTHLAG